ncbi:hypothetical protein BHM03_00042551 [Ensete ventricosum]|nr:hypothetical protein BHM03_00042551 [Ensete ventricosum]
MAVALRPSSLFLLRHSATASRPLSFSPLRASSTPPFGFHLLKLHSSVKKLPIPTRADDDYYVDIANSSDARLTFAAWVGHVVPSSLPCCRQCDNLTARIWSRVG